jgi:catechol 2,3-dioxygenase-like lactoylglutathione lyase family enzyme
MKPRGIDHLVLAVRELEAARAAFVRLGFTLTPVARHPWGTVNSLAQFDGAFLELLAVADPAQIPEPTKTSFSFGAFNRRFLEAGEGLSMLVLKSADPAADRAAFSAEGLAVYEPFRFERVAKAPDGGERKVAFSLTFTSEPRLKRAGFFTCQHHYPENFWRAEYQHHANGARRIVSAVLVTRDPADFHEFLTHFTGQREILSTSLGVSFDLGDGSRVEVMSPLAFRAFFGIETEVDPRRFMAWRVGVADVAATRDVLKANGVAIAERDGRLVVGPADANGAVLSFESWEP